MKPEFTSGVPKRVVDDSGLPGLYKGGVRGGILIPSRYLAHG
jgi:hypothetical protein